MTAGAPVTPAMVTVPVAVRVTVLAETVPPWVLEIVLLSVSEGSLSLVKVQLAAAPAGKPAAAMSTKPAAKLFVVLPAPVPEHTMFESV